MTEEYDSVTAEHYRAYRPPLHSQILRKGLGTGKNYSTGLDVGSGTGHSALALTDFCDEVVGVEPSAAMRIKALEHPKVSYFDFDGGHWKFKDDTFDIFTFAGSLYYAKSQRLLDEVFRTAKDDAIVFIYDFELLLEDVLAELDLKISEASVYNHQEDFSGLGSSELVELERDTDQMEVSMKASDLAHILLSVKIFYDPLVQKYGEANLFGRLVKRLIPIADGGGFRIKARTFHQIYRVVK